MTDLRGIDTNIVLRLLLRDDPVQARRVDALVADGNLLIPFTVLIETEWVLRAVYKLPRAEVSVLLHALTRISGLVLPDRDAVRWACQRHAAGADFADMIHLVSSGAATFLTFDDAFIKAADGGFGRHAAMLA